MPFSVAEAAISWILFEGWRVGTGDWREETEPHLSLSRLAESVDPHPTGAS